MECPTTMDKDLGVISCALCRRYVDIEKNYMEISFRLLVFAFEGFQGLIADQP